MHRSDRDVALELGILGAAFALIGAYNVFRGWSTAGWRPVPGEITEAYLSEEEREDDDDNYATTVTSYFRSRILYKYAVHGKEYEGRTLQRGLLRVPFKFFAQQQADAYQRGDRVTVYYLPRDPSQAVLKRGAPPSAFILLAAGLAMVLVAYKVL
jgi:hypothetical protein